jgi:NitT/TauT family transport system substrate-binding protein
MKTDRYAKNGIGWMEDQKMCTSVELVNTYMGVPTKVDCKAVYTNEFLTKVEPPRSMR